jgi:hypothetical protein
MSSEQLQIGDFGQAHLIYECKGLKRGVTAFGTIKTVEKKYVLFQDNDGYLYLCDRKTFDFNKCEFENKIKL